MSGKKDLSGMADNKRMRTFISPDSGRHEQLYLQHSLYCVLFSPTQTFRPKGMLKVTILSRMKGNCSASWKGYNPEDFLDHV